MNALEIPLEKVVLDNAQQMRIEGLDDLTVQNYAGQMQDGEYLPPIIVLKKNGQYICYDGFHRVTARNLIGEATIEALIYEEEKEAQEAALKANLKHGRHLSIADKKRLFRQLAYEGGLWENLSNRKIAQILGVSHVIVGSWETVFKMNDGIERSTLRLGADGRIIDTAKIGSQNQSSQHLKDIVWKYPRQMGIKLASLINLRELDPNLLEIHEFEEVDPSDPLNLCVRDLVTDLVYGGAKPRPVDLLPPTDPNPARREYEKAQELIAQRLKEAQQEVAQKQIELAKAKIDLETTEQDSEILDPVKVNQHLATMSAAAAPEPDPEEGLKLPDGYDPQKFYLIRWVERVQKMQILINNRGNVQLMYIKGENLPELIEFLQEVQNATN
jgi:uncharacterized ParB-like nuclease family protein